MHLLLTSLLMSAGVSAPVTTTGYAVLPPEMFVGATGSILVEDVRQAMFTQLADSRFEMVARDRTLEAWRRVCHEGTEDCAVRIGNAVSATHVVASVLSEVGSEYSMDLLVVDIRAGATLRTLHIQAAPDHILEAAREAVVRVVDPALVTGSVLVQTEPAGAEIYVDGVARDHTPMAHELALTAGRHELEVRRLDVKPHHAWIDVAFQRRLAIDLVVHDGALVPVGSVGVAADTNTGSPTTTTRPSARADVPADVATEAWRTPTIVSGWSAVGVGITSLFTSGIVAFVGLQHVDAVERFGKRADFDIAQGAAWTSLALGVAGGALAAGGSTALVVAGLDQDLP